MKREEQLTVTVFGDHRTSRTFLLPRNWIPKLGLLLCVLIALAVISVGLAVRYYKISASSQPWRVRELEDTIAELRKRAVAPAPTPSAVERPVESGLDTAPPPNLTNPIGSLKTQEGLFTGIPLGVKRLPPNQELPIEVGDLKAQWIGKNLEVYFSIRYVKKDGGNQQGRIVILAWGPEAVFSYPPGTLNPAGSGVMLNSLKGEFFSVSRYREVKAQFGSFASKEGLKKVEVLIFGGQDELIFHQIFAPGQEIKAAPPQTSEPLLPATKPTALPPASAAPVKALPVKAAPNFRPTSVPVPTAPPITAPKAFLPPNVPPAASSGAAPAYPPSKTE